MVPLSYITLFYLFYVNMIASFEHETMAFWGLLFGYLALPLPFNQLTV